MIKAVLYRMGAVVLTAAAMLGLFAATGFPEPLARQLLIVVPSAIAIQAFVIYLGRTGRSTRRV